MHYSLILEKYKDEYDEDRCEAKFQVALKTREYGTAVGTNIWKKERKSLKFKKGSIRRLSIDLL
jgi:hypothetical protein